MSARTDYQRVFVTGIGVVSALGVEIDALAEAMWGSQNYLSAEGDEAKPALLRVPEFELSDFVSTTRPYLDPHSRYALAAVSQALDWARGEEKIASAPRSGLSTATVFGNMKSQSVFHQTVREKGMRLASPVLFPHCYPNTTNSLLSIEFGLRGYNQNFGGDSACGAKALQAARQAVSSGCADLMVAGGCDAISESMGPLLVQEAEENGDKLLPAEGAGFLVFENEKSIATRRSLPLCEVAATVIRGTGVETVDLAEDDERRVVEAVRSAIGEGLEQSGLWEGDLGAVFLAGSSAGNGHLRRAVSEALDRFSQLPVLSPHRSIGCPYAAGFPLQCLCASLVVNAGRVPTSPKLDKVRKGVELWVEEMNSRLLGEAVMVLDWSARNIGLCILKMV